MDDSSENDWNVRAQPLITPLQEPYTITLRVIQHTLQLLENITDLR